MATLFAESIAPAPYLRRRAAWGAAMFTIFMAYCEGYSLIGEEAVSPLVSARWALAATATWGLLLVLLHANRLRLRSWAAGSWQDRLGLLAALFGGFLVTDQLSLQLSALLAGAENSHGFVERLYFFAPRALMLGAIVVLLLLLWERRAHPAASAPMPVLASDWLAFPESPMLRLRATDVSQVRSAGNYSELMTGGRGHLVRIPLGDLADRLAPLGFLRVHRQIIVNGCAIREICRGANGRIMIRLHDGEAIFAGRRYTDDLRDRLAVALPDLAQSPVTDAST